MTTSTTGTDQGLRERKKRQTRLRLHRSALRLVGERSLDRVTVEEIAEDAEVSTRTFFNYFASKDAAVIGSDPDLPERVAAAVLAQPADRSPVECLHQVFLTEALPQFVGTGLKEQRWRVLEQHPHLIPATLGAGRQIERRTAEALAQRLGLSPDHPYPALVAACGQAAVRVALECYRRDGESADVALDKAFAHLSGGLAAPVEVTHRVRPEPTVAAGDATDV